MKLVQFALAILLGVSGCAFVTDSEHRVTIERAHETTLHLVINGDESCSGTAIGPHALLSATHCFDWPFTLKVYGQPVRVIQVLSDGNDHTILIVGLTFKRWAALGGEPRQADRVFIFGNPGRETDLYRDGVVYGLSPTSKGLAMLYGINGFYGDSGSGVFNRDGKLVAIISYLRFMGTGDGTWQAMGSFPLAFTPEQLSEAAK